jgi:LacI family transcriptional regulator
LGFSFSFFAEIICEVKKKILISDIAKALGVSTTTVSFVLNGRAKEKRLSDELAKRVLDYVHQVGYKPNELAKSLRTGKTKILGLIIEDISNPFFANIARYIESKAYSRGYRIFYSSTENNLEKAKEFIHLFRDRHVDGYLITPPPGLEDTVSELIDQGLPVVLFDRYFPTLATDYVVVQNKQGAIDAVNHLVEQGFKKIAFVTSTSNQTQMQGRLDGYQEVLARLNRQPLVKRIDAWKEEQTPINDFYRFYQDEKPDAILFSANHLTIIGLKALKQYGLPMPGLISFDDHTHFRISNPTISVVSQPISQIAEEVINILINRLEGKLKSKQQLILPTQLIIRESSIRSAE